MIEDVQEVAESVVFLLGALDYQFGIWNRHHARRRAQAHEVHLHLGRAFSVLWPIQRLNFAGRKCQSRIGLKAHRLVGRRHELSNSSAMWEGAAQQTNSLEEGNAPRFRSQLCNRLVDYFGLDLYIRIWFPERGGHARIISFLCLLEAVSWEKLFMET